MKVAGADVRYHVDGGHVEGGSVVLDDATVLLINPWTVHSREALSEGEEGLILCLSLEPSWVGAPAVGMLHADPPCMVTRMEVRADAQTCESRDAFVAALHAHRDAEGLDDPRHQAATGHMDTSLEAPLDALLDLLIGRHVTPVSANGGLKTLPIGCQPVDPRIRRAICLMRHHICKEPGIDAIAVAAGLSRSRFFEQFRDSCGVSPRRYADILMIEEAVRRLTEEDHSIAEISKQLGFSAQSHFTRFFRQKAGVSPSAYRRATQPYRRRHARNFDGVLTSKPPGL